MALYIIKTYGGYYVEYCNGTILYHGKPVLNDIGCEDIVKGIAKQASIEMKDKVIITKLEDKYFDSVDYEEPKTFNTIPIGTRYSYQADKGRYEYVKITENTRICVKSAIEPLLYQICKPAFADDEVIVLS